jgi:hypothetical protein
LTGRLNISSPLRKAYGLTNPQSLGYLFSKATKLIKVNADREWINPYHDFLELVDLYRRHFRNLAEKIEFGDSIPLWELNQLIKHIVSAVGHLIEHPPRPGRGDENELINELESILSFFWVAFDKKKLVNENWADEACETLVYTGLLFFDRGYPGVLKSCVSLIKSIVESYCKVTCPPNDYALGDFFAHLWSLRLLSAGRGNAALTQVIDQILTTKPEALTDERWRQAQRAIELRKNQLEQSLGERHTDFGPDCSENLLRRLLQSNADEEADNDVD